MDDDAFDWSDGLGTSSRPTRATAPARSAVATARLIQPQSTAWASVSRSSARSTGCRASSTRSRARADELKGQSTSRPANLRASSHMDEKSS